MAWSAKITEKVNQIAEIKVNLWTPVMSPQINTLTWAAVVDDLAALTATDEKLMADSGYLDLVTEGNKFNAGGGVDDALMQLVHADPRHTGGAPPTRPSVTAILAPGRLRRRRRPRVLRSPSGPRRSLVVRPRSRVSSTGVYGEVSWFQLHDSIEQVQAADEAIDADADFGELLDEKASKAYLAGQSVPDHQPPGHVI